MKKEKPNACWKCGQKNHIKKFCPNKEVPGVAWVPGYEPKEGTQRRPPNPPQISSRKPTQVFSRTENYMATTNKVVNDNEPDCVKIFANALAKATATEENVLGNEELIRGFVHSIHTMEQDLVRRESDSMFGALRRARAHLVEKEEAMRSFIIKNLADDVKDEMTSYLDDPKARNIANKEYIADRVHIESGHELDPKEIDSYEYVEKKFNKRDPNDATIENEYVVWNLKITLFRRDLVLKIIAQARESYPEGFDPEVNREDVTIDEFFTVEEIRNDTYVKTQAKARNEMLLEKHGNLSGGEWKFDGKRGVRRLFFEKIEAPDPPPVIVDSDENDHEGIEEIVDNNEASESDEYDSAPNENPDDDSSKRPRDSLTPSTGGKGPRKKTRVQGPDNDRATTNENANSDTTMDDRSNNVTDHGQQQH